MGSADNRTGEQSNFMVVFLVGQYNEQTMTNVGEALNTIAENNADESMSLSLGELGPIQLCVINQTSEREPGI